jgi:hypothetical protein
VRVRALPEFYHITGRDLLYVLLRKGELFFTVRIAIHSPFRRLTTVAAQLALGASKRSRPINWKRHEADMLARPGGTLDRRALVTTPRCSERSAVACRSIRERPNGSQAPRKPVGL